MNYAIFIAASRNVLLELFPLLNSLDCHGYDGDIIILCRGMEDEIKEYMTGIKWTFNIRFVELEVDNTDPRVIKNKIKYTMCTYRHSHMAKLGVDYAACLMLDADMVVLSNITDILSSSVNGNIYGAKNTHSYAFSKDIVKCPWVDNDGKTLVEVEGQYWNTICTIPLFMNVKMHKDVLLKTTDVSRRCFKDDYQILNFCIHQLGKSKHVIPMKNSLWIGTQMSWFKELYLKPVMVIDDLDDRYRLGHAIVNQEHMFVRSLHSHWWYNDKIEITLRHRIKRGYVEKLNGITGSWKHNPELLKHAEEYIDRKMKILNEIIRPQFLYFSLNGKAPISEHKRFLKDHDVLKVETCVDKYYKDNYIDMYKKRMKIYSSSGFSNNM